ncbi:hypothetical protein niasHT_029561 [Heterodera trifolii]|uniref:Uncharacterized protein n=1 Tax=Heterodera trifolii TaxID=157864 RepID=A0ABD2JB48_9BILA
MSTFSTCPSKLTKIAQIVQSVEEIAKNELSRIVFRCVPSPLRRCLWCMRSNRRRSVTATLSVATAQSVGRFECRRNLCRVIFKIC